ncbi:TonB-dependent receptor [Maribacter dokdonensis]|uniref:TonB-dependent receptor n=1 Tax=Maribacter dokdonensis TaxID=320912 RepID=UPI001C08195C|nr:TonB-dependent receptor [Maribacter dokdonensis]MBU2900615.1 TonB-dependent receptor [Maribacter dokdonensis]
MIRSTYLTVIFFLTFSLAFAQDFTINGSVVDENNTPVVLANVILMSEEGEFIKGTVTNDQGDYRIHSIAKGNYRIVASYIANTVESDLLVVTSSIEMPPLVLQSAQELDEVVVTQNKPKLEQLADRHIFNVENTAISDGDIWDVLKRTPGVMVMNNRLYVNGSANVNIMINGKLVNLPEEDIINLLSGSSASNVQSIEVITSPPAKYSAEGGLLIDIKMKKNLVAGYNGAVFNRYTQGVLPKHTVGTDHFFKGKRVDFSTNYSFSHDRDWTRYSDATTFYEDGQENEIWTAEQKSISKGKSHNLNLFLDIELNEKNALSFSSTSSLSPDNNTIYTSSTDIESTNADVIARLKGLNTLGDDTYNTSNYLDWVHKLDDKGAEIATNAHFTYYDSKDNQELNNDIVEGFTENTSENTLNISSDQIINLFSAQTDLTLPLSKRSTLETGLKFANINSESSIQQSGFDETITNINPSESGIFNYDEQIYAGYVSLSNSWKKWKLNVGLRAEYTDTKGELNILSSANTNSYFDVFPNLSMSYTKDKNAFMVKYYRRITRPRYSSINPFQYYISANSIFEGNPNLKPAYRSYIEVDYVYDKDYKFALFTSIKSDQQVQQFIQDNTTNFLIAQYINLETNYNFGADASVSKYFTSYWYFYFLVSQYYNQNKFVDVTTNAIIDNSTWTTYLRANNYFTLLKDESLYADMAFTYISPYVQGNASFRAYSKLGINFRKTFWNKDASISIGVEDIFNKGNIYSTRNYLEQNNSTSTRRENRLFVLGFRYKFGNTKIRDNSKSKSTDENNRL